MILTPSHRFSATFFLAALWVGPAMADTSGHEHRMTMSGNVVEPVVGTRVDDFQLIDHEGDAHRLYYYSNASAIVIMTQGNGCPIVRNAMPTYKAVRDEFEPKGVRFFLLNSNLQDTRASIAAEVAEFGYDMPVLVDDLQLIGESLNVTRTAEVYVIDPADKRIVYHGPVDDRLTYQQQKAKAGKHYLRDALYAMLAGEPVPLATAEAPGCLVNFPERTGRRHHAEISYADTIAPLLERRCVDCHQVGGIAPWPMNSYTMVRGFAPMIREVLRTDRMPPWHADPDIGTFLHDRSLEPEEIKALVHWIEAGAPRGEGSDPRAKARDPMPEWPLGEPDLVLDLPPFEVPATGVVEYRYPVVANPLTEGKWLRASTVKVGSRETVHHLLSGYMREVPADGRGSTSRWGASMGGYAVGAESQIARENLGTYVPPGGAIGFQLHYTPYGKAVTDRTQVGLYFYDEPPELILRGAVIMDVSIRIPPHAARHEESAYLEFPKDALLYYAFPHAHYRGQSSSLAIRYPDGVEKVILSLPKYDFNWQRAYEFAEPVEVPAGSKLIARYTFDNSSQNHANPDPSKEITWGEQSHDEMLFTALSFRWKEETRDAQKPEYNRLLSAGRFFGMLDDDVDDRLGKRELKGRVGRRLAHNFERLDLDGDGLLSRDEYALVAAARRGR